MPNTLAHIVLDDEEFVLLGRVEAASGTISVRGFVDASTVEVYDLHEHSAGFRDGASMVGLFLSVCCGWSK